MNLRRLLESDVTNQEVVAVESVFMMGARDHVPG